MEETSIELADAARYLEGNTDLRHSLDIARTTELTPHYLGEGEHNRNFWFSDPTDGRRFVLRINVEPQPFHKNQVAYEFAALTLLEPCGRTPIPLYLDDSPQAPGKGALVETFCGGKQLNFDSLQPGEVRCAVQILADIHAVPVAQSPAHALYRPVDPLRGLFDECLARFKNYRASGVEDPRLTRWAERFIAAAQDALDTSCLPEERNHIVNTETLAAHFLIPEESAKKAAPTTAFDGVSATQGSGQAGLSAKPQNSPRARAADWRDNPGSFIDWERPIIGEVAQDLAYFVAPTTTFWDSEFFFTAAQAEEVVEEYWRAVDGRFARGCFDARFRAFRMMTALRSTTWFCKALPVYLGMAEGHMTQRTRRKFPHYLSDSFMEMLARDCFGLR